MRRFENFTRPLANFAVPWKTYIAEDVLNRVQTMTANEVSLYEDENYSSPMGLNPGASHQNGTGREQLVDRVVQKLSKRQAIEMEIGKLMTASL